MSSGHTRTLALTLQDEDRRRHTGRGHGAHRAALTVAGSGQQLAVDANGRFDLATALAYARAIEPYGLRWYEEIGDPLDYDLNRRVVESYAGPVATGENLFSVPDVNNLLLFGGMRPGHDVFQMDAGLSYGLGEYVRMLNAMEARGFSRGDAHPHGGHLINLHIAVGLGLGGCEAYPGVFQPLVVIRRVARWAAALSSRRVRPALGWKKKSSWRNPSGT